MNNLKKTSWLIIGSVLFFACSQEKNKLEPKTTVIAGVVNNFSDKAHVLVINYCNPLSDERQFAQNLTESNGFFQVEHEYVFAQNITIRFANRFINLFVRPGDSIFISIDANEIQHNFKNTVAFSGDNSEVNRELFLWTNESYDFFNQNSPQFDDNASSKELLESVQREFDKAEDYIKAYAERTNMSDFLKNWAYVDRKFIIANDLLDYYIKNKNKENLWDIFTNPIFDVFNGSNFQTMFFQYHLPVCMNILIQSEAEISRMISGKEYIPATKLIIEKLHEKAPKGVVRDVMFFNFLKSAIKEKPELCDSIPNIKTFFSQDFFTKELEKLSEDSRKIGQILELSERESQLEGVLYLADSEMEELPSVKLLNFLSEKHKGKVLYIDVWATWCGPCIEEFKFTPNLHKYFEDKDVVFINLCLESNIENWKPAIERYTISGEHYFLGNNDSQLFRAENNLAGFPSYLLIDKNGEIHYPIPRPSDLESAIKKIEKCLQ